MQLTSKQQLRLFGILLSIVICIWITVLFRHSGLLALLPGSAYILAMILFMLALIRPEVLSGPYQRWTQVAHLINRYLISALLIFIFYAVITPLSLVKRALNKDEVGSHPDHGTISSDSYRNHSDPIYPEDMENPF
ncbi:hypothetical protein BGP75_24470 [Motiliproteus sp. MSK22-1]|nr:hypothetical protein BGP75_24470 [Motiliproteus sp. MSK22-1]